MAGLTAPTNDLTGNTIATTYDQLVILDHASGIAEATVRQMATQAGLSALWIAGEKVYIQSDDSEQTELFNVENTSNKSLFKIDSSTPAIVINEDSIDMDFRVEGNGNANLLFCDAGDDRVGIGVAPTDLLTLQSGAAAVRGMIDIKNTGNNPASIVCDANITSTVSGLGGLRQFWNGTEVGRIQFLTGTTQAGNKDDAHLVFYTKEGGATLAENMRITTVGNVGIGTDTPISALEIEDGLTTGGAILTLGTKEPTVVANDVLGRINFYAPLDTGTDSDEIGASISAVAQDTFSDSVNSTALYFQTGKSEDATGTTASMVIDEDGKVGINETSPDELLHITDTAAILKIESTGAGSGTTIKAYANTQAKQDSVLVVQGFSDSNEIARLVMSRGADADDGGISLYGFSGGTMQHSGLRCNQNSYIGIGGVIAPTEPLSVSPIQHSTGTASQSGNTVTGAGGASFSADHLGAEICYADGSSSGVVTAVTDSTHLEVTTSQTVSSQAYQLVHVGLRVETDGNVGIGCVNPARQLEVSDYESDPIIQLFRQDTDINDAQAIGEILWAGGSVGAPATRKTCAFIEAKAEGDWVADSGSDIYGQPAKLSFFTQSATVGANGLSTPRLVISSAGNTTPGANNTLSLGTDALEWTAVWAINTTIQSSDERLKENIQDLNSSGLEKINALKPRAFDWKKYKTNDGDLTNKGSRLGFIAQEVQNVIPEMVYRGSSKAEFSDKNGKVLIPKGEESLGVAVSGDAMMAYMVKAIQELSAKVTALENA